MVEFVKFEPLSIEENDLEKGVTNKRNIDSGSYRHIFFAGNCLILQTKWLGQTFRLTIGPHWPGIFVAIMTLIAGTLLFLKLLDIRSYRLKNHTDIWTVIFRYNAVFMFFTTLILLLCTALSDPGIVLNENRIKDGAPGYYESESSCDESGSDSGSEDDIEKKSEQILARLEKRKNNWSRIKPLTDPTSTFCDICEIEQIKSLKIHHCYDCDVCVEGLDHHCPWMGKCVGKKNMFWFICFNISWILFITELLVCVMFM